MRAVNRDNLLNLDQNLTSQQISSFPPTLSLISTFHGQLVDLKNVLYRDSLIFSKFIHGSDPRFGSKKLQPFVKRRNSWNLHFARNGSAVWTWLYDISNNLFQHSALLADLLFLYCSSQNRPQHKYIESERLCDVNLDRSCESQVSPPAPVASPGTKRRRVSRAAVCA